MRLRVNLPTGVLLDEAIVKVVAEGQDGCFCLLPRHVDFVSALVPGILMATLPDGTEVFLAVDEGVLVKRGAEVQVSTWNAVRGPLGELKKTVREQYRELGEKEHKARSALNRIEASLVQQILEWEEWGHG